MEFLEGFLVAHLMQCCSATKGSAADLVDLTDLKKAVAVDNADLPSCSFVTNS